MEKSSACLVVQWNQDIQWSEICNVQPNMQTRHSTAQHYAKTWLPNILQWIRYFCRCSWLIIPIFKELGWPTVFLHTRSENRSFLFALCSCFSEVLDSPDCFKIVISVEFTSGSFHSSEMLVYEKWNLGVYRDYLQESIRGILKKMQPLFRSVSSDHYIVFLFFFMDTKYEVQEDNNAMFMCLFILLVTFCFSSRHDVILFFHLTYRQMTKH